MLQNETKIKQIAISVCVLLPKEINIGKIEGYAW